MSQPLDIVHSALAQLHALGVAKRASMESLDRLRSLPVTEAVPVSVSAPQPEVRKTEPPVSTRPAMRIELPAELTAPTPKAGVPKVEETSRAPRIEDATSIFPTLPGASHIAPDSGSKADRLAALRDPILSCAKCPNLVKSRSQVVFGVGNPDAELMFVGEAPGADEDLVGEPFVGKAGQLLTKIIETMGFRRSDVYIANVLKCRPNMPPGAPGNRKPTPNEMSTCKPYLMEQIQIIQPRVIVALGGTAVEGLLDIEKAGITRMRGHWQDFHGIPMMPTFHPSYVLRSQSLSDKRAVWEDMLAVMEKLDRPISDKQRAYFLPK